MNLRYSNLWMIILAILPIILVIHATNLIQIKKEQNETTDNDRIAFIPQPSDRNVKEMHPDRWKRPNFTVFRIKHKNGSNDVWSEDKDHAFRSTSTPINSTLNNQERENGTPIDPTLKIPWTEDNDYFEVNNRQNGENVQVHGSSTSGKKKLSGKKKYVSKNDVRKDDRVGRNKRDSPIIFPGQDITPLPPGEDPECANGTTFCVTADNYPSNYVRDLVGRSIINYNELYGVDTLSDIEQRIDSGNEGIELCDSVQELIFPKAAKTRENEWYWIVNEKRYVQGIRIERCRDLNGSCSKLVEFGNGYKASCEQKYILRRLLAVNSSGLPMKTDFEMPGCCQCVLRQIHNST